MKYFLKLFLLFTCPVCISASEINQTTFAYWNKPDVEIYYISPDVIDENTKVIFVIHGNSRNAEDYLSEWRPYIACLLYTSPSPRDGLLSRMPSSA